MFTLDNVFEKRSEFENACKKAKFYEEEFHKLLKAETKSDFMQVIYDNFNWVYKEVTQFGLKYDYAGYFNEGITRVGIDNKYGFIDTEFKEICEIKYDDVGYFNEGFARVKKGDKWWFINRNGKEYFSEKCHGLN